MVAVSEYNSLKTYTAKEYEDKQLWNEIKGRFGKQYSNMDAFSAWQQMNSEELMSKVDELLKSGREIGQGNGETRYQLKDGREKAIMTRGNNMHENRVINSVNDLANYGDSVGVEIISPSTGNPMKDGLLLINDINKQLPKKNRPPTRRTKANLTPNQVRNLYLKKYSAIDSYISGIKKNNINGSYLWYRDYIDGAYMPYIEITIDGLTRGFHVEPTVSFVPNRITRRK